MKEKVPTFLFWGSYNPDRIELNSGTESLNKHLHFYLLKYNFAVKGNFKVIVYDGCLSVFCNAFNSERLILEPTCHKSPGNPSWSNLKKPHVVFITLVFF